REVTRSSAIAACAAFGLLASHSAMAALDAARPLDLVVHARVADGTGWPIPRARVIAEGAHGAGALTGDDGRCAFRIPLGAPGDLAAHPVWIALRASARGRRVAFADGSDALRLDVRVMSDGAVRVRSNQASLTLAIAAALR